MKKVIALCLFAPEKGNSTGLTREANLRWYCAYLPLAILGYSVLFPEFEIRLHSNLSLAEVLDDGTTKWAVENGILEYVYVDRDDPLCLAMLWRLMPLFDPEVEYLFCRDIDAVPFIKDRKAVEAFIKSKYYTHALLDNTAHRGLMGGMCGFYASKIRETLLEPTWESFMAHGEQWEIHGADQVFLAHNLWNPYVGRRLMHDFIDRPSHVNALVLRDVDNVVIEDIPAALQNDLEAFSGCVGVPIQHHGSKSVAEVFNIFKKHGYFGGNKAREATDYLNGMPHNLQMDPVYLAGLYASLFPYGHGTFVEVGAFDGQSWSHTLCLAKLGWKGLYVEPQPSCALLCVDNHKKHPSVTTVCCACGDVEETADLYVKGAVSSLVLNKASDAFGLSEDVKIQVSVQRLDSILGQEKIDKIDVLVVDVEGFEAEVLKGFDVAKYKPKLAIIETHELSGELFRNDQGINELSVFCDAYFVQAGYDKIFADDGNTFYLRA